MISALMWACTSIPVAALAALVVSAVFRRYGKHSQSEFYWFVAIVQTVASVSVALVLSVISNLRTTRYDLYINQWESSFGYPASRAAFLMHRHEWLRILSAIDYELYAIFVVVLLVPISMKYGIPEARRLLVRFVLCGCAAVPFYLLFPASGPYFALPDFPHPSAIQAHAITLAAAPNCIPSVHMALALMVFWYLRRWRIGLAIGSVHIILTVIATLGFGQHYLLDLVMAVPYTFAICRVPDAAIDYILQRPLANKSVRGLSATA